MKKHEIGGEFLIEHNDTVYNQYIDIVNFYGKNHILLDSGRSALKLIAKNIERKTIYLPNYICESVIQPFKLYGFEIYFYNINQDFQPQLNTIDLNKKIGAFLHMGYFGFDTNNNLNDIIKKLKKTGTIIIEDITHTILSKNKLDFKSDYYIASLRKWIGIYDGAVLITDSEIKELKLPNNNELLKLRKVADKQKNDYLNNMTTSKKYLDVYMEAEKTLNGLNVYSISDESKLILATTDFSKIQMIRRNNYKTLRDKLANYNSLQLKKHTVPLSFPMLTEKRNSIRKELIKEQIFCPIHWPRPKDTGENILFDLEISIPIDQRYNLNDMTNILTKINKITGSDK